MFDTHCHLQFPTSSWTPLGVNNVVRRAKDAGVNYIVVPGTDVESSVKAVQIAQKFSGVYAAVGIHPHHIFKFQLSNFKNQIIPKFQIQNELKNIEKLMREKKVVAVGEVGVDRHYYKVTKYSNYQITNEFIKLQKEILKAQIKIALKYRKAVLFHSREATEDLLEVLKSLRVEELRNLEKRAVFHCCEPKEQLLEFAKAHKFYIGVDGDVTYSPEKAEFVKKIPLEMLVLETDSPFLTPEPIRSSAKPRPQNEPANLKIIAEFIAKLKEVSVLTLASQTTTNARNLFGISQL